MSDTSTGTDGGTVPHSMEYAELFERSPEPTLAVAGVESPSVVVANPAYGETFVDDPAAGDGGCPSARADFAAPEREVLRRAGDGCSTTATVTRRTAAGARAFEVRGVPVESGEVTAFLCYRDVTCERICDQQRTVLRRVLRHNVRNTLTVLLGYAEEIEARADADGIQHAAATIYEEADELHRLADLAGRMDLAIEAGADEADGSDPVPTAQLSEALEVPRQELDEHYDGGLIVDPPEADPEVDGRVGAGLAALCRAFVERGGASTGRLDATAREDAAEVVVAADAALDADQRAALEGQPETQLEHATGVSAWLARWTLRAVGGEIDVEQCGPERTVLAVTVPAIGSDTAGQ